MQNAPCDDTAGLYIGYIGAVSAGEDLGACRAGAVPSRGPPTRHIWGPSPVSCPGCAWCCGWGKDRREVGARQDELRLPAPPMPPSAPSHPVFFGILGWAADKSCCAPRSCLPMGSHFPSRWWQRPRVSPRSRAPEPSSCHLLLVDSCSFLSVTASCWWPF